jgi:hypothetical protein
MKQLFGYRTKETTFFWSCQFDFPIDEAGEAFLLFVQLGIMPIVFIGRAITLVIPLL